MAPMRVVTVRRWEVIVAFFAVTLAYVVGLVWLSQVSDRNHELILRQRALSAARVADRQRTDAVICRKVDRLDRALVAIVSASPIPSKPGQPGYAYYQAHPDERRTLDHGRAESTVRALAELKKAACDPRNLIRRNP